MRLAVLTDVHGNRRALYAALADLRRLRPDRVIFGGDVALFGSHPLECWQRVRDLGWDLVQGNTDRYIGDPGPTLAALGPEEEEHARFLRATIDWVRAQLGQRLADELRDLPHEAAATSAAGTVLVVHGAPGDDELGLRPEESDDQIAAKIGSAQAQVVVCGHTHTAFIRHVADVLVVNCGSVGRSHDGQPGQATYAVLDDSGGRWSAEIRRVAYDHEAAHRELLLRRVPLSEAFAATLLTARPPG